MNREEYLLARKYWLGGLQLENNRDCRDSLSKSSKSNCLGFGKAEQQTMTLNILINA